MASQALTLVTCTVECPVVTTQNTIVRQLTLHGPIMTANYHASFNTLFIYVSQFMFTQPIFPQT